MSGLTRNNLDLIEALFEQIEWDWEHRASDEWPTEERLNQFKEELQSLREYLLPNEDA